MMLRARATGLAAQFQASWGWGSSSGRPRQIYEYESAKTSAWPAREQGHCHPPLLLLPLPLFSPAARPATKQEQLRLLQSGNEDMQVGAVPMLRAPGTCPAHCIHNAIEVHWITPPPWQAGSWHMPRPCMHARM